jgi:integrase/recombinase XerC
MSQFQPNPQFPSVIPLHPKNRLATTGYSTLLDDWLARSPSHHTRRIYRTDIRDFFETMAASNISPDILYDFLTLEQPQAFELVSQYHGRLIERSLAPATINRKLAAIKSLVNYAAECGKCRYTLTNIKTMRVKPYRDTRGFSRDGMVRMLKDVERTTLKGKRDYAILLLLWGNALRRSELVGTNIGDFDSNRRSLKIIGKGRGGEAEYISLGAETVAAIQGWLAARGESNPSAPLFSSIHKGYWGHRLITHSIYKIVRAAGESADIGRNVSPHKIRHSSITAALDATDGDVRKVQKHSRHSNLNTLMIYDDNRQNYQGEVTNLLEDLIDR